MKYSLLVLLACAVAGLGQPVEGPWVVMEVDTSSEYAYAPLVVDIDVQTARIFFSLDSASHHTVNTVLYDMEEHQLMADPVIVRSDSLPAHLKNAIADGVDSWVVVMVRPVSETATRTLSIIGHQDGHFEYTIGSSYPGNQYFAGQCVSKVNLAPRIGGGWLMTYVIQRLPPPYFENESQVYVVGVSSDSIEYRQPLIPYENQLFGPYQAAAVSFSHDTSLVLTQTLWGQGWPDFGSVLLRAVAGGDSNILDTVCTFSCGLSATDLRASGQGEFITYSAEYASHNSLFHVDETGSCTVLGSLAFTYEPERLAFEAGFGYAALWRNSSWIKVARIGEDGTSTEPGVFYWRSDGYRIGEADLTITPDGRIHVLWTEAANGYANASRLMTGWINWDTPLSANPSDFIPYPSGFSLSCYPNPFNPTTTISFELPRGGQVTLDVYDLMGRLVQTLVNESMTAGSHQIAFDGSHLASGIYWSRLNAGGKQVVRKMVLLR